MLSDLCKTYRRTTITAVGELETGGKSKGDSLRAVAMRYCTADQIRETGGFANSGFTVQKGSLNTSIKQLEE